MKKKFKGTLVSALSIAGLLAAPMAAHAASTVVVTQAHDDGWSTADTRPGGQVQYVYDPSSPAPDGALQLTTDSTNTAKAQYMHSANTALSDVNTLGYSTKQIAANTPSGDPSYQLTVCLGGYSNNVCTGGTNLVYEPYWNGTVVPGIWQTWNVDSGQFWSSQSYTDSTNPSCTVQAGAGGAPFYTLADLTTACPNAQVVGFGVNVGTYNPGYVTEVDNVVFNDWTYDFQLTNTPTSKDACKNGGWNTMTDESGAAFKNQGDCVSWTNANKHMSTTAVVVKNSNQNGIYSQVKDNGDRHNAQSQTTTQNQ